MNRFALSFAALTTAIALAPLAAAAQNQVLSTTSAAVEIAALELPASSSASAPDLFAAAAQSSITTQVPPVLKPSQGSRLPFSGVAVAVKVGTAGIGFDVATPLVPGRLNLRGGASFFSYNTTITTDNININGSLKFQNAEVVADFFPFGGWFRISGGGTVYNNTGLTASLAVPGGQSFSLGNDTYYSSPSDPIHGTGAFNFGGKTAGRVSIGTGNMLPKKGHFRFESEIGVQFFSSPTVLYNIGGTGCQNYNGVIYTNCGPVQQSDVLAEQNKLQNDLTDLKYFPIVSFGLSYKIH
jgi:hypothetical protein